MDFRPVVVAGIGVVMTTGCARLSNVPAQYNALPAAEVTAEVTDDTALPAAQRRSAPRRSGKVQSSATVEPIAVLEASVAARRSWKPQDVAALENTRPSFRSDPIKGDVLTGSIKRGGPEPR